MRSTSAAKVLTCAALLTFSLYETGCGDNKKMAIDAAETPKACLDNSATPVLFGGLHSLTGGSPASTGQIIFDQSLFAQHLINEGCGVGGSVEQAACRFRSTSTTSRRMLRLQFRSTTKPPLRARPSYRELR